MKIGEAFTYKIDGRTQIIRKEESYYITYIAKEMAFYKLSEFPFQTIKHTLSKTLHYLERYIAKHFKITLQKAKKIIKDTQKELREINLLK